MERDELVAYYARRAAVYEEIYRRPERQADLAALRERLVGLLAGRDVLEIACGTGYWTAAIADSARSVLAIDAGEEVLETARRKALPPAKVTFRIGDAWSLEGLDGPFTGGLAAFWWSHVPHARLGAFLDGFHAALAPGALVVHCDNRYVEGSSLPTDHVDERGDAWQIRTLPDGSRAAVIKNFPGDGDLRAAVAGRGEEVAIVESTYFWCLSYRTIGGRERA